MARRKTSRIRRRFMRRSGFRRRGHMTLPLAVIAGFVPEVTGLWARRASAQAMGQFASASLTGYLPGSGFTSFYLKEGAIPILAGFMAHWVAARIGINRLLARARVPLIRI